MIGMDNSNLYYVGSDGKPKPPIDIKVLQPAFSLMVANDSIMLITSTNTNAAQVVSYGTDGIIDGAITLTGEVERENGTFVPCSQPVIAGFRVYLITQFVPTDTSTEKGQRVRNLGMQRLYALDLRLRMADRIHIAWFMNLEMEDNNGGQGRSGQDKTAFPETVEGLYPIVMYYKGVVYINNAGPMLGDSGQRTRQPTQPYPATLIAVQDNGDGPKLLYKTPCSYGSMAAYDTYNKPLENNRHHNSHFGSFGQKSSNEGRTAHKANDVTNDVIWILNRSPAMVYAQNALNGSSFLFFDLAQVANVSGWATSLMGVTRQAEDSTEDNLVIGMQDSTTGEAYLVSVLADRTQPHKASLLWKVKVGSKSISKSLKTPNVGEAREKHPSKMSTFDHAFSTPDKDTARSLLFKPMTGDAAHQHTSNAKHPKTVSMRTHADSNADSYVSYTVSGQIVNVAVSEGQPRGTVFESDKGPKVLKFGVVAMVTEVGPDGSNTFVTAVF